MPLPIILVIGSVIASLCLAKTTLPPNPAPPMQAVFVPTFERDDMTPNERRAIGLDVPETVSIERDPLR